MTEKLGFKETAHWVAVVVERVPKKGDSGELDCPRCGGIATLRWGRSPRNGHLTMICKTPKCLCFMQ